MDIDLVESLIALVGRSAICELELTSDGSHLRMVKGGAAVIGAPPGASLSPATVPGPVGRAPGPPDLGPPAHVVRAGLVGTFYRSPAPGQPPFVSVGEIVEEGQTLGLLEAMKTLIPVQADEGGRIGEIQREDGTPVQAGDPLFTIDLAT